VRVSGVEEDIPIRVRREHQIWLLLRHRLELRIAHEHHQDRAFRAVQNLGRIDADLDRLLGRLFRGIDQSEDALKRHHKGTRGRDDLSDTLFQNRRFFGFCAGKSKSVVRPFEFYRSRFRIDYGVGVAFSHAENFFLAGTSFDRDRCPVVKFRIVVPRIDLRLINDHFLAAGFESPWPSRVGWFSYRCTLVGRCRENRRCQRGRDDYDAEKSDKLFHGFGLNRQRPGQFPSCEQLIIGEDRVPALLDLGLMRDALPLLPAGQPYDDVALYLRVHSTLPVSRL